MLLEKAYAKLHGGYKTLTGGLPAQGMQDLTGCPTSSFKFSDSKVKQLVESGKLWDLMVHFDQEGFLLAGGTPGEDMWTERGIDAGDQGGLVPGHAYSVIQVKEAKTHRLLQIRNPWGKFEWNGDWSDGSALWTDELKEIFSPKLEEGDGTFWMSF